MTEVSFLGEQSHSNMNYFRWQKFKWQFSSEGPYYPAAQDRLPTEAKQGWAGQYLDGRPPGKTRLLLEEVLVRPAGGAHPAVCVGPNAPVLWPGHYTVNKHRLSDETLNQGPDSLWSLKIPWHFS